MHTLKNEAKVGLLPAILRILDEFSLSLFARHADHNQCINECLPLKC